jgi:hypothetical protein
VAKTAFLKVLVASQPLEHLPVVAKDQAMGVANLL